ncbi:MAG TPA: hypothetical protein VFF08_09200 [Trueperaceae bacterium]|nr:hypothetical protein [Trueperaceae bacterium]
MAKDEIARLIRDHELLLAAAAARGVKPVSDLPGSGFGSFAEDDPEVHESFRDRNRGLPEGDEFWREREDD